MLGKSPCRGRLSCLVSRQNRGNSMRFEGTEGYVATDDLKIAVNAAITLERPLLVKGEPGTGKTVLALEIAKSLSAPLLEWHVKSTTKARRRPIVVITSNNEKELPDAFLRRCFFHYIRFPDGDTMRAIIEVHFPGIKQRLVAEALRLFYEIRDVPGLKKKPSTSELLDWLKLLMVEDIGPELLRERDPKKLIPPLHGALLKNEQDVHLFERLAFLARRDGR